MTTILKTSNEEKIQNEVFNFLNEESLAILQPDKLYLNDCNFGRIWGYEGLPIVYIVYSLEGKALFCGLSKDCTGQKNYFKEDTGDGVLKQEWPMGTPHYITFYCLSKEPLKDGDKKLYDQLYKLRRVINKIIKEDALPVFSSIGSLLKEVPVSEICNHLPWIGSRQAAQLEVWHKLLTDETSTTLVENRESYYLYITLLDWDKSLPKIDLDMIILNTDKKDYFMPIEQMKDFGLIRNLPIYAAHSEISPWKTALNILLRISGIELNPDE